MQIPNTTNLLEGFNSQLKRALHNHNGLNEANKKKFIDGFINTKKRVCQNSFSAKDSYHFVKNYRYQRVNNSMITVTLIFMRE